VAFNTRTTVAAHATSGGKIGSLRTRAETDKGPAAKLDPDTFKVHDQARRFHFLTAERTRRASCFRWRPRQPAQRGSSRSPGLPIRSLAPARLAHPKVRLAGCLRGAGLELGPVSSTIARYFLGRCRCRTIAVAGLAGCATSPFLEGRRTRGASFPWGEQGAALASATSAGAPHTLQPTIAAVVLVKLLGDVRASPAARRCPR